MKFLILLLLLVLFVGSYSQEGYLILHRDNKTNKDGFLNTKGETIKHDEYEMWESEDWFFINKSGEGVMPTR